MATTEVTNRMNALRDTVMENLRLPVDEELGHWESWRPFPDPRTGGVLIAPIGAGAFEVRHVSSKEKLLLATANSVSARLCSLLPQEIRPAQRDSRSRRQYLSQHILDLEYRFFKCLTKSDAATFLRGRVKRCQYRFGVQL